MPTNCPNDETLEAALQRVDLSAKSSAALVSTLLDDRTLGVLQKRADREDVAKTLLRKQYAFLGRDEHTQSVETAQKEDIKPEQEEALRQDPTAIGPSDLDGIAELVSSIHFPSDHRDEFLARWLNHWRDQGKACVALDAIREAFAREDGYPRVKEILDHAFKVSLDEEGKDAAYEWLVKAQIYRHGWGHWTSEDEVMSRLTLAAQTYPERWQEFIQDSSKQTPYFRRRGYRFTIGYKYLVRYLVLVGQVDVAHAVTLEFVKTLISEVSDQPIPSATWLTTSDISELEIDLLFQRLNWPVPMVRWRAARAICELLGDKETRQITTTVFLRTLERCVTESETCSLLNILLMTSTEARPQYTDVAARIFRPSSLSHELVHQIYKTQPGGTHWRDGNSGQVPEEFKADSYFDEHKTAQVPGILADNLRRFESQTGLPFRKQWAYEWKRLRDEYNTRYTRYPYYFDSFAGVRDGITGQYLQRQAEIYRSAYLRVLSVAVDQWGMPEDTAARYGFDIAPAIDGIFQLEPTQRPGWLADLPERCLDRDTALESVVCELIKAGSSDDWQLVCLQTPFREGLAPYGDLSVSAFFLSDDFQLHGHDDLYEPTEVIILDGSLSLNGNKLRRDIEDLRQQGSSGTAVPVCVSLLPMPFGYWHGDYFSRGVCVPGFFCVGSDAALVCDPKSIELLSAGQSIARTQLWHDAWSPLYPRGGSTRIGMMSLLYKSRLKEVQTALGHRLAWFAKSRVWKREGDYGEFKLEEKRAPVINDD